MGAPIFPHCSYLLALGHTVEFSNRIHTASVQNSCRSFLCGHLAEFKMVSELTDSLVGVIVSIDEYDDANRIELGQILKQLGSKSESAAALPILILTSQNENVLSNIGWAKLQNVSVVQIQEPSNERQWQTTLNDFFKRMSPAGLNRILLHSLNLVLPNFFFSISKFNEAEPMQGGGWDYQLNYSLSAGDLVGLCSVRVKWSAIMAFVSEDKREKSWDILKESLNQTLGVVIQNIVKIGIDMKLGLPTVFDLSKVAFVQTMKFYPSVFAIDQSEAISVSIGFHHLSHGSLFDLSSLDISGQAEEIEFL